MYNILVCDDEEGIRTLIAKYAKFEGHNVIEAENGMQAIEICRNKDIDIIVMDIMMPELDGFSAVREIRKDKDTPVIMLSARGEEYDRIHGFEVGADDYLVKPFGVMEMVSRVKAVLRRVSSDFDSVLNVGKISLITKDHVVKVDGEKVSLTLKEYELLKLFMENVGIVFSRNQLLSLIWSTDYVGESRTVDMHIKNLRQKLSQCGKYIQTVIGVGYKMERIDD